MPQFIIALVVLFGGLWVLKKAGRMQPRQARAFGARLLGSGALALSGLLAMRGAMQLAVPLFLFGLGLLGFSKIPAGGFKWPGEKSSGQRSTVATAWVSMELDHDSGEMRGKILQGTFSGRTLSSLSEAEAKALYAQCAKADRQTVQLLEAWLDRYHAEWRTDWFSESKARSGTAMSRQEALDLLGLKEGADESAVRAAHRRLMKEYHPDRGGTDYLAAKINEAKDVLLST